MCHAARLGRTEAVLIAALILGCHSAVCAATKQDDDLASRFVTAPEATPDQQQLAQVEVNGVAFGNQLIRMSKGRITPAPQTVRALGIADRPGEALDLSPESGIAFRFDEAQGTLFLTVPVSMLAAQRFAPEVDQAAVRLSPETWEPTSTTI
jgi:hypothetical protein